MQSTTMHKLTFLALTATAASTALFARQDQNMTGVDYEAIEERLEYLIQVCNPRDQSDLLSFRTPCNTVMAIEATCTYGTNFSSEVPDSAYDGVDGSDELEPFDVETQRVCMCQSQLFDSLNGCNACKYCAMTMLLEQPAREETGPVGLLD